ncbi:nuclear transport factor 2 family protein [Burkholderia sp. MR1-5-21]
MNSRLSLEKRIQRLEAAVEIQNLMSKYQYLHSAYLNERIVELFADRDDLSIDAPFGRYYGRDAARRCFGVLFEKDLTPRDLRGEMVEHTLTTPIIEVAGDAQTAKAVWNSPGHEAHKFFWVEGSPRIAFWNWLKYSVDFIRTEAGWRIWHLRVYSTFAADYYKSWVDAVPPPEPPLNEGDATYDEPPRPSTSYSTDRVPQLVPVPPEPYETFESEQ